MSAPAIASTTATRTAPPRATLALATVIIIVAAVGTASLVAWHPWSASEATEVQSQYGAGYPQHGGLAGPSRVSVYDQYPGYWRAYLTDGGHPGPSRASTAEHPGYGAGYPLHGGLAGPSQIGDDE